MSSTGPRGKKSWLSNRQAADSGGGFPLLARDGEGGGNLLSAGDHLIVVQPQRITVYGPEAAGDREPRGVGPAYERTNKDKDGRLKLTPNRGREAAFVRVNRGSFGEKCPCGDRSK